jgi:glycosyltransferase involved in cell wall biosynthesis
MSKPAHLLVLAPFYDTFIKGTVDALATFREIEVTCLVCHNRLTELTRAFPKSKGFFDHYRRFSLDRIINNEPSPPGVRVLPIEMIYVLPNRINYLLGDTLYEKTKKIIKREGIEFDLIHAHFTYPFGYVGARLKEEFGVPLVTTVHENRGWLLKEAEPGNYRAQRAWKCADTLIRVNMIDIPLLKRHAKEVVFIPSGFDPARVKRIDSATARRELGLPANSRILFTLAGLHERKGHRFLIEAMKYVSTSRTDVLCVIGGSGPSRRDLEKLIDSLGLRDCVKLVGQIPEEQIHKWYSSADLFVLPSLSEGNPAVMMEALGAGVPFIGSSVGGIPEVIVSNEYGLLVDPADSKKLAKSILEALDRSWDKLRIASYSKQFSYENNARLSSIIYDKLLNQYNSRSVRSLRGNDTAEC